MIYNLNLSWFPKILFLFNLIFPFLSRIPPSSQLWRLKVFVVFNPFPFSISSLCKARIHIPWNSFVCLLPSWLQPCFELTVPTLWTHPMPLVFCSLAYLFSSTWNAISLQVITRGYKQLTQMQPCPSTLPLFSYHVFCIWFQDILTSQLRTNLISPKLMDPLGGNLSPPLLWLHPML